MRFKQTNPQPIRSKYRLYSPSALTSAYRRVKEDGLSVLKASRLYRVPENTLRDRVLGKIDPETVVMGKLPLFDQYEESKIVTHFKKMASYGYGYTRQECVDIASNYAVQLGKRTKDKPLSIKWLKGFLKRWPEMKVVKPRALEHVRAKMTKESTVMEYFEHLERCIRKHDLADKPHLIFNVDEKGLSIDHKPPYIVGSSDSTVQAVTSGKGQTVTVIGCGSASGVSIPPYFVFAGKRMNPDLLSGASPGAAGTMSESGWSNTDVFRKYLQTHFLKFVPGRQGEKIILLLDGHRSHIAIDYAEWAKKMNIIIFVLPAHTSHLLQPLDVACYGPFERIYNILCHKVIRQTSAAITRYNICDIACKVYTKALCAENLQAAFQRTGIYPLNREAIPKDHMVPSEVFDNQTLTVVDEAGNESDATVEGGIIVAAAASEDIFEKQEMKLKTVKSKVTTKPRKTISKLVSGKELTSDEVVAAMQKHVEDQQKPAKKSLPKSTKMPKSEKRSKPANKPVSPQPGPSHINLLVDSSQSSCDDDIDDSEKCCVCGLFTPSALANAVSITFTKWAQCDGMVNGNPCKHWTHLIHCTGVRVIRRGDTFLCPHCENMEE